MSSALTVNRLAEELCLPVEHLRARGVVESSAGVTFPYAPDSARKLIVTPEGKYRREGWSRPDAYGWSTSKAQADEGLIVVTSEFAQLALSHVGIRSVAITDARDAEALNVEVFDAAPQVIIIAETSAGAIVDQIQRHLVRERRHGCTQIATLVVGASSVFSLFRKDPDAFEGLIRASVAAAVPLLDYVKGLPGTLLSDVKVEPVEWLWQGQIPLGKHTDVAGDPGAGKTVVFEADLVARVTTGREMPDGTRGVQGGVVICNSEDGAADTLLPRILAAGGDPSKVVVLSYVPDQESQRDRPLMLPADASYVEAAARRIGAVLILVDPLPSFLPKDLNANVDQDVRIVLGAMAGVAKRTGAALITIRHLNKDTKTTAMYRSSGSIGITGIARAAYLMAKVPGGDGLRALVCLKSNLGPEPKPLGYRIVANADEVPVVEWKGVLDIEPDDLLRPPHSTRPPVKMDEALDFVRQELGAGPVATKDLEQRAKAKGIAKKTLERARSTLGVVSKPGGFQEGFVCSLPDAASNS